MTVTVYSLPDCPKCDKLKAYLKSRGIEFKAKWFDTEAQADFIMMNMFGNPPVLATGERVEPSETLFEGEKLKEEVVFEMLN
jgi:glutaredoxin